MKKKARAALSQPAPLAPYTREAARTQGECSILSYTAGF
jgi:hypothetical protein